MPAAGKQERSADPRKRNGMPRPLLLGEVASSEAMMTERFNSLTAPAVPSARWGCRRSAARLPFEHEPRRHAGIGIVVLVAVVHHLGDAGLDDGLGALVAGRGSRRPGHLQVVVGAVQDGVELRMADIHIYISCPAGRPRAPTAWHRHRIQWAFRCSPGRGSCSPG